MQTQAIRCGQTEIGIISHNGHEFAAMGSTVQGRSVTGYARIKDGIGILARWQGSTMTACRAWIAEQWWSEDGDVYAMVFALTGGRFIVGYSLGMGMLFRGELITGADESEANRAAISEAEYWMERDDEEQAEWDARQADDDDSEDD